MGRKAATRQEIHESADAKLPGKERDIWSETIDREARLWCDTRAAVWENQIVELNRCAVGRVCGRRRFSAFAKAVAWLWARPR